MTKIVDGIEYLDYEQAAIEYGLSIKSIPSMVTHGTLENTKFKRDNKPYIARKELENYNLRRKKGKKRDDSTLKNVKSEVASQERPFSIEMYKAVTERMALEEKAKERERFATVQMQWVQSLA